MKLLDDIDKTLRKQRILDDIPKDIGKKRAIFSIFFTVLLTMYDRCY